ncbi:Di-copper centre-containing protein [Russula vinacea]|nr:Di-copper centre-containing protein [Russula vinacea]
MAFLGSAPAVHYSYEKYTCTQPAIRREWRAITTEQKAEWIRAVHCLSQTPHDPALAPIVDPSVSLIPPVNASSSYYDDIVYLHMDLNTRIHWTGQFLPWHRWFVHIFEESLKNKCGYTACCPIGTGLSVSHVSLSRVYGSDNWLDAPNFYESSWWKDSDPQFPYFYPSPHTIRRNFSLFPFDVPFPIFTKPGKMGNISILASTIEEVLDTPAGDFKGFQVAFEAPEGSHSGPHALTGGDMAGTCPETATDDCIPGFSWTPNDPLFYLHHAMVDKIWYDWQKRDPVNVKSFSGGSVQQTGSFAAYTQYPNGGPPYLSLDSIIPADGMFPEVTIGDVMDTTGGFLCYVYE